MDNIKSLYKKYLELQAGKPQNMADGGLAKSNDSVLADLAEKLQKAFSSPKPAPTPDPSLQDKYKKVRDQNTDISSGKKSAVDEQVYNQGGKVGHNKQNLLELKAAFDKFLSEEGKEKMSNGGIVNNFVPKGNIKHYDEGGPVSINPERHAQLKKVFPDWDDAKIEQMMKQTDPNATGTGQKDNSPIPQPNYMNPVQQNAPVDSGNLAQNTTDQLNQMAVAAPQPAMADGGQVGMGDVQRADAGNRTLPIMTAGFSQEDNPIADQIQSQNRDLAQSGLPMHNVSQNDINDANMAQNIAMGTMGGIKQLPEDLESMAVRWQNSHPSLSLNDARGVIQNHTSYPGGKERLEDALLLKENGPKYKKQWEQMMQDRASDQETVSSLDQLKGLKISKDPNQFPLTIQDAWNHSKSGEPYVRIWDGMQGYNKPLNQVMHEYPAPLRSSYLQKPGMAHGGMVQHFDGSDGSVVLPDLSPEEIAAREDELKQLQSQGADQIPVQGDEQDINASLPAKESDVENSENPEDKELEEKLANEDFKAGEDDDSSEKDDSEEPSTEEGMTSHKEDALKENPEKHLDEAAGLQVSPDVKKQIESVKASGSNDLKDAQRARDIAIANQQFEKGGALLGAGIAGKGGTSIDPSLALKVIGDKDKYVNLPVQKYEEQIANQQNDPDSPMSKMSRDYFKSKGIQVPENASAADLKVVVPNYQKDQAYQMALQKVIMQQKGAGDRNAATNKAKEDAIKAANDRSKASNDLKKQENQIRQDQLKASKQTNQDNKANNDFEKMGKLATAEIASSRSPFGKSANVLRSAEQIEGIGKQYTDTNQLDNRQIAEIARSLDSMLSNGAATVSGSAHLLPSTASGSLAKIEEYITNLPAGARQKEFVDRMMDTVKREKDIANKQMVRTQGKILAPFSHLKQNYPDRYNATLKSMGIPTEEEMQNQQIPVDADLTKLSPDELKNYIKLHGGQ